MRQQWDLLPPGLKGITGRNYMMIEGAQAVMAIVLLSGWVPILAQTSRILELRKCFVMDYNPLFTIKTSSLYGNIDINQQSQRVKINADYSIS